MLCNAMKRRLKKMKCLLHWAKNKSAARTESLVSILPEAARPDNCDRRPGYARRLHPFQAETPKLDEWPRQNRGRRNDSQLCRNTLKTQRTGRSPDAIRKRVPEHVSDLRGNATLSREALTFP